MPTSYFPCGNVHEASTIFEFEVDFILCVNCKSNTYRNGFKNKKILTLIFNTVDILMNTFVALSHTGPHFGDITVSKHIKSISIAQILYKIKYKNKGQISGVLENTIMY